MADESEFDFLGKVKMLLKINEIANDEFLLLLIDLVKQKILNYCNIDELPSALYYTLCAMCVDVYNDLSTSSGGGVTAGVVSSISEDGRTVSFDTSTAVTEISSLAEDKINKKTELNRYKKLYRI